MSNSTSLNEVHYHPMVVPYDARFFSEWSGAMEPMLLHWCNEAHDINTDIAGRFLNLDIQVIKQMWDNMNFAVQNDHIYENTHLAHVFPDIKDKNYYVFLPRHHDGPARNFPGE
jgi:hypothetical protein